MAAILKNPFGVGILTFIAAIITISTFMGPTTCKSGWKSPSIGRQGACSHNGGVDRTPAFLRFIASLGLAIGAGVLVAKRKENGPSSSSQTEHSQRSNSSQPQPAARKANEKSGKRFVPPQTGTSCPRCNEGMRAFAENGTILLKCDTVGCETTLPYR